MSEAKTSILGCRKPADHEASIEDVLTYLGIDAKDVAGPQWSAAAEGLLGHKSRVLLAQRNQAMAAVEEWHCRECNTVFPRGHVKGFGNLSCSCGGGFLRPSSLSQRMAEAQCARLQAERDELLALARMIVNAKFTPEEEWPEIEAAARAAITKTEGGPNNARHRKSVDAP